MNNKPKWYADWHRNPRHKLFHWAIFIIIILISTSYVLNQITISFGLGGLGVPSELQSAAPRGTAGDFWADVEVGRRDFTEISAREIVPYKLFGPGGVVVDRSVSPGRMYIWDSGNNRILGVDLATCSAGSPPCRGTVVIGQPTASDYGACNLDSSFQNYPDRPVATASTLCGVRESTHSVVEDKTYAGMFVDTSGNLYVPDVNNHRVLKYISPFTTDTIADEVWGQTDFTGVYCNRTPTPGDFGNGATNPTAQTLCFLSTRDSGSSGASTALDAGGNLWVADGGNNRILRYPVSGGIISKTADLVLGQSNFTSAAAGSAMNKLHSPYGISFGPSGELYVADQANNRVLKFSSPFITGMSGSVFATLVTPNGSPVGVEAVPGDGVFVVDWHRVQLFGFNGISKQIFTIGQSGGSLGRDALGNILAVESTNGQTYGADVNKFTRNAGGIYSSPTQLFSPPGGYNLVSTKRIDGAGGGIAVAGNQLAILSGTGLFFWNGADTLSNGKAYDGSITNLPLWPYEMRTDAANRLWIATGDAGPTPEKIYVYQTPLVSGQSPLRIIDVTTLPVVGGGTITLDHIAGIAPTPDGNYVWLSEPNRDYDHSYGRVVRIKNPLTAPTVDVVLGQTNLTGNLCNRGVIPEPNTGTPLNAALNMLCRPGDLTLDRNGNLFVSDHFHEAQGNWRLLMFSASLFPANPTTPILAPNATKEFPRQTLNGRSFGTFETAFDSANHMVVGFNPYLGPRFPAYYNDPTRVNPTNPSDISYARPDGYLKDFYSWAVGLTFDAHNNLYVYDGNRGQIRIYKNPFGTSGGDIIPPTESITSPTGGTVTGTIPVAANATDNIAVAGVQFKLDGVNVGTEDTTSPYSVSWNTATTANGTHALTAIARDTSNNLGTSAPVSVTVNNVVTPGETTPPTVSITAPTAGSTVSGTTNINANASDNVAVAGVQFKLDGANLGTEDTASPYSVSWNTSSSTNGSHALSAIARDTSNNSTTSSPITVTVNNAGGGGGSFSDNFNRTKSDTLGNGWTQVLGAFGIDSNHALHKGKIAALAIQSAYVGGTESATVDLQRTSSVGASKLCLMLRYQSATNFYAFCENQGGSSSPHIYKVAAGAWTQLDTNSKSSGNSYVYRRLTATATGATLTLKLDGATYATVSNSAYPTGSTGFYINSSSSTLGEYIENFTASVTP